MAIARGTKKIHIHFLKGNIVYATSSYMPDFTLGDYLMREGKISIAVHEDSLEHIRKNKVKQGMYLVEKGYISPHELYEALNHHIMEKLFQIFKWTEGEFFFKEGDIVEEKERVLNINFPNIIYTGIRHHMLIKTLPVEFKGRKESIMYLMPDSRYSADKIIPSPQERKLLSLVNGKRKLRELAMLSKMDKKDAYKTLYALYLLDIIGFAERLRARDYVRGKHSKIEQTEKQKKIILEELNLETKAQDLISQALASVDRIHLETVAESHEEPHLKLERSYSKEKPFEKTSEPAAASAETPVGAREESLQFHAGKAPKEDLSHFGFDEKAKDGFGGQVGFDESAEEEELSFSSDEQGNLASTRAPEESAAESEYHDFVDEPQSLESIDETELINDPEELVKLGIDLLQDGKFAKAEMFFKKAVDLDPNMASAYPYLGWAHYNASMSSPDRKAEAELIIKQGIKINNRLFEHFLYMGKIYQAENQPDFAELYYVKALELNRECIEARDQIKKIRLR